MPGDPEGLDVGHRIGRVVNDVLVQPREGHDGREIVAVVALREHRWVWTGVVPGVRALRAGRGGREQPDQEEGRSDKAADGTLHPHRITIPKAFASPGLGALGRILPRLPRRVNARVAWRAGKAWQSPGRVQVPRSAVRSPVTASRPPGRHTPTRSVCSRGKMTTRPRR